VKKSLKKLNLCRETLRVLEVSDLGRAEGGGNTKPATTLTTQTQDTNCDCTLSCPYLCQFSYDTTCFTA